MESSELCLSEQRKESFSSVWEGRKGVPGVVIVYLAHNIGGVRMWHLVGPSEGRPVVSQHSK